MIFKAILSNPNQPDYGVISIPFPIPREEYDSTIKMLAGIGIGSVLKRDCKVEGLDTGYAVLKRLEMESVNVEEMDYLAKRLDSFTTGIEDIQFLAMAEKLGLSDVKDFINLTFCCQKVTVINDFSKLKEAGKTHFLHLRECGISMEEFKKADGEAIALSLLRCGEGHITPYGVVYDNGMELEQIYRGGAFPEYLYDSDIVMGLTVVPKDGPEDAGCTLTFPMSSLQLKRSLMRVGINSLEDAKVTLENCLYLYQDFSTLDLEYEGLDILNEMCTALAGLDKASKDKLRAVTEFVEPRNCDEVIKLAEELDLFAFVPDAKTPEAYGRYMIQESGHFEYDPNLDEFIDYAGYAKRSMENAPGKFTDIGYVSYQGDMPLEELLGRKEEMLQMGGFVQ